MASRLHAYDGDIVRYHGTRSSHVSDQDWEGNVLGYCWEGMRGSLLEAWLAQGFAMDS